jgi:hypothetical protein
MPLEDTLLFTVALHNSGPNSRPDFVFGTPGPYFDYWIPARIRVLNGELNNPQCTDLTDWECLRLIFPFYIPGDGRCTVDYAENIVPEDIDDPLPSLNLPPIDREDCRPSGSDD